MDFAHSRVDKFLRSNVIFENYLSEAVLMVALFSGLPLIVSSTAGLIISMFQAATQIQEQSVSYLVKLVGVGAVMYFGFNWYCSELITFTQKILESLPMLGRT